MTAGTLSPEELGTYKSFVRAAMKDRRLLDRVPAPPPFQKGHTLKYIGPDESLRNAVGLVTWTGKGMQGDLTQLEDIDGKLLYWNDDKDAPILIRTVDGSSGVMVQGRIVRVTCENAHEWELLKR